MAHTERDTTGITAGIYDSGAGWFLAGMLIAIIFGGAYAYSTGMIGGGGDDLAITSE